MTHEPDRLARCEEIDDFRALAGDDSDFDPIRATAGFRDLFGEEQTRGRAGFAGAGLNCGDGDVAMMAAEHTVAG